MKNNQPLAKQSQEYKSGFSAGFQLAWKWHTIFLEAAHREFDEQIRKLRRTPQQSPDWAVLPECERTTLSE